MFILGLLIGAVAGAVGGFLFARNSKGQSEAIVKKYEETIADLKDQITKIKN